MTTFYSLEDFQRVMNLMTYQYYVLSTYENQANNQEYLNILNDQISELWSALRTEVGKKIDAVIDQSINLSKNLAQLVSQYSVADEVETDLRWRIIQNLNTGDFDQSIFNMLVEGRTAKEIADHIIQEDEKNKEIIQDSDIVSHFIRPWTGHSTRLHQWSLRCEARATFLRTACTAVPEWKRLIHKVAALLIEEGDLQSGIPLDHTLSSQPRIKIHDGVNTAAKIPYVPHLFSYETSKLRNSLVGVKYALAGSSQQSTITKEENMNVWSRLIKVFISI